MGANEDVDKTVGTVEKTLKEEGSAKAYEALQKDFQDYAQGGNRSAADIQAYWNGVNEKLKESGTLGTLSLEYAKSNPLIQESSSMQGGTITAQSVERQRIHNERAVGKSDYRENTKDYASERFDLMFQNELRDQFRNKQGIANDGYIHAYEINERLSSLDHDRTEQNEKEGRRSQLASLISVREGREQSDLFTQLDTAKDGGKGDGRISKDDLDAYTKGADRALQELRNLSGENAQLPDKFDPNNPLGTRYNKEWLDTVKHLQEQYDTHREEGDWNPFTNELITRESLAKSLGYKDAATMNAENTIKPQTEPAPEVQPEQPEVPAANQDDPDKALKDRGNDLITAIRALPQETMKQFDDGMSREEVQGILNQDRQDNSLTQQQRNTFTALEKDWDTVVGAGKNADVNFLAGDDYKAAEAKKSEAARTALTSVSGADMSSFVDDKGNVDKAKLEAYVGNDLAQANEDPQKMAAYSHLLQNFDQISHDGKTFTQDQLKAYAAVHGAENFEPYKAEAPGANPEQPAPAATDDAALKEAIAKMGEMKQTDALGKGGTFYDLATRAINERAAVTGEKADPNAIMREVARIVIVNEIGPESVRQNLQQMLEDPNAKITGANLPKALNSVSANQQLKIYGEGDHERYAKRALAQAAGKDVNNDGKINEDDYGYTGG
jgi:hypothetical protein